ncbi:hypothetical protein [Pseudomonas sp. H9]|uniref:hypothetical protein n=1 Tax=Pseudomonas sp. H9 TaxID=483968 RepID=UPI00105764EF|nr:hypothetical protein [Pseudomonas sp. H9]TDF82364.1 hypothetical protein E1573_14425 [Pseudomonas sp. H9]
MSFVPSFFDFLTRHLQHEERRRMLASMAVTAAPEHWLSLEAAALLDIHRERFDLGEPLNERLNVPRWLVAAERKKVDIWVEDQRGQQPPHALEFKVVHNNKNAYQKIYEIRRDLQKVIPNTDWNEHANRWGIVLLAFHHFYDDQSGNYSVNREFKDCEAMLEAFQHQLQDDDEWYAGVPKLELVAEPTLICDMTTANYIDAAKGPSALYMALVQRKH